VVLVVGSLVGEPKPGRLGVEREAHALSRVTEPPLAGLSSTAKRAKRIQPEDGPVGLVAGFGRPAPCSCHPSAS